MLGKASEVPARPLVKALPAGTVLASRFTLQALVGHGGMGTVYLALDALSGRRVAIKLLHSDGSESLQRFVREASVLAELRHPGIVSYVAHGTVDLGFPFLAMEWLEGEDLAHRLARQPLNLKESLALLRSTTQALAAAHQQGVIHRDIKPSNLFLRHGHPEDVVLLDFGLARHLAPSRPLTASQMVLGTPGYMAPEQVSTDSQLTPSADIFSLGCVFYECLTGKAPFAAPHFVAALGKILFTEPEPLASLRPELPSVLQELLERMLAKAPKHRLPAASSLLEALEQLQDGLKTGFSTAAPVSAPALRLTNSEQHLVSVLLAAPRASPGEEPGQQDSRETLRDALRALLSPHGAQVELLANGSLAATLAAAHGSATDLANLTARCALFLQERWPQAAIVLTTGRGRLDPRLPVGEAMDRAGQLLSQVEQMPPSSASVLLDEVTAGLLGPGFQLTRSPSGLFLLQGERLGKDESRPLLGKPTPCLGREQELALLEGALGTCVDESTAQAVLITAPPGTGKSRLRHEFLRRIEHQGRPLLVLLGRGDPMRTTSAEGLIGQALCRLCGVAGSEPLETRQVLLRQRLAQHLPPAQAQEVVEFLGDLCGIPFPDEHNPRLRAARVDSRLMAAQFGRALVAFLRAECSRHPVLLVLEDLHWADVLSIRLMDEALRELAEQPFMVLALARPEVEQILSPTPAARRMQQLPLRGMSRKAGTRLVREVLGAEVPDALIDRLVEQAAGNALFLEELIRGVAEGRGEAPPETVLAMLQARLLRLEPRGRQVLLAGSFFGRTFWSGGIRALLGEEYEPAELEEWLRRLEEMEWVEHQPSSRFPGEEEYRFRHALVRDAAYGLVPDSHKPTGHQLAGPWLEEVGESDPRVLAEHASWGQQPARAIHFYTRAAEQAFDRHDMQGMERCITAAMTHNPSSEVIANLRGLQATAALWMDDFVTLYQLGSVVLPKLKPGELRWCHLLSGLCLGYAQSAQKEAMLALLPLLLAAEPEPEARCAYYMALCFMGGMCWYMGAFPESEVCFERLERSGRDVIQQEGLLRGWRGTVYSFQCLYLRDEPWQALTIADQALEAFHEVGSEFDEITALCWGAHALLALGSPEEAMNRARQSVALGLRAVQQPYRLAFARHNLAMVLAASPEPAHLQEAKAMALESLESQFANRLHLGSAHLVLARVAAGEGNVAEAESQARKACELLVPFAPFIPLARWMLGALLLVQGRAAEARSEVELALREAHAWGDGGWAAVGLRQVQADACFALGDTAPGEQALRGALQCLRARAANIPDKGIRERFVRQVPENARTVELARQRWGEADVA